MNSIRELEEIWNSLFGDSLPLAHILKFTHKYLWVRFHSLPESKRYPDSDADMQELLDRHYKVLGDLSHKDLVYVVKADIQDPEFGEATNDIPESCFLWREFSDPDSGCRYRCIANHIPIEHWSIRSLLSQVALDEVRNVMLLSRGLHPWMYHPYDGGADVFCNSHAVKQLRVRYASWLSSRPDGY